MIEIIIGLFSVFAVLLGHLIQKKTEFKSKITEKKRLAYETFLENFITKIISIYPERNSVYPELDKHEMIVMSRLLLFAPDKIVRLYFEWIDKTKDLSEQSKDTTSNEKEPPKSQEEFGRLLLSIRNDILGKKSKLTKTEVNKLLPMCGAIEELITKSQSLVKKSQFDLDAAEAYRNRAFDD